MPCSTDRPNLSEFLLGVDDLILSARRVDTHHKLVQNTPLFVQQKNLFLFTAPPLSQYPSGKSLREERAVTEIGPSLAQNGIISLFWRRRGSTRGVCGQIGMVCMKIFDRPRLHCFGIFRQQKKRSRTVPTHPKRLAAALRDSGAVSFACVYYHRAPRHGKKGTPFCRSIPSSTPFCPCPFTLSFRHHHVLLCRAFCLLRSIRCVCGVIQGKKERDRLRSGVVVVLRVVRVVADDFPSCWSGCGQKRVYRGAE